MHMRSRSYLDRVSIYDTQNRVFYLFYMGKFHNRAMYHYGETNDIAATEFFVKSHLPFYELLMYIPIDTEQNALHRFTEYIQPESTVLPVHSLEHLTVFTPSSLDIKTIVEKIEELYRTNVDKEYG